MSLSDVRIMVSSVAEADDYHDAYEVTFDVWHHGAMVVCNGTATVAFDPAFGQWRPVDNQLIAECWLSDNVAFWLFALPESEYVDARKAILRAVDDAADKHDAARGRKLLERALEADAQRAADRLEDAIEREADLRRRVEREDAECDRRGLSHD